MAGCGLTVGLSDGTNSGQFTENGELWVASRPRIDFTPEARSFTNPTFGSDLAQTVAFTGTPIGLYNGGDTAYWTPTTIIGNAADFREQSTTQAFDGIYSLDGSFSENNDTLLLSGTAFTRANYTAITGAIFITGWSPNGTKGVGLQFRIGGVAQGVELNLGDYVDTGTFNVWQTFAISLADFGIVGSPTSDELTIRTIDIGGGAPPNYFLDVLQVEEIGSPLEYRMTPDVGEVFYVEEIRFVLADNITGGLSYDKFMALTKLSNGLSIQVVQENEVTYSYNITNTFDLILNDFHIIDNFDDGVNTAVTFELSFEQPLILKGAVAQNYMCVIVNDDMSGLLEFRAVAEGYREISG